MKCTGTVVASEGDIADVLVKNDACGKCHACGLGALREHKNMVVKALNRVGAQKDDRVDLEISGRKVMEFSAVLFLIPFGGFIVGFLLGYFGMGPLLHFSKTGSALITGFVLLAASYYLVYLLGNRSEFEFVIKGMSAGEEPPERPAPGAGS